MRLRSRVGVLIGLGDQMGAEVGRRPISHELQALISARMTAENRLWGQKRIEVELARLGFSVSARIVGKYMSPRHNRGAVARMALTEAALGRSSWQR
jgi:hypothetical protein